jgi:hypothetical protein
MWPTDHYVLATPVLDNKLDTQKLTQKFAIALPLSKIAEYFFYDHSNSGILFKNISHSISKNYVIKNKRFT